MAGSFFKEFGIGKGASVVPMGSGHATSAGGYSGYSGNEVSILAKAVSALVLSWIRSLKSCIRRSTFLKTNGQYTHDDA